eukprot:EG_transcript_18222
MKFMLKIFLHLCAATPSSMLSFVAVPGSSIQLPTKKHSPSFSFHKKHITVMQVSFLFSTAPQSCADHEDCTCDLMRCDRLLAEHTEQNTGIAGGELGLDKTEFDKIGNNPTKFSHMVFLLAEDTLRSCELVDWLPGGGMCKTTKSVE